VIAGIFLTHGMLGEAIFKTTEFIMGKQTDLYYLSNVDSTPQLLYQKLLQLVDQPPYPEDGAIIMVCLKGGNTWHVACKVAHERPHVRVISGLNLAMAFSLLTKRDKFPYYQLVQILKQDSCRNIDIFPKNS